MTRLLAKSRQLLLGLLALVLLAGAATVQRELNRDRDRLGLTRLPPLENAPPVLAFTTVALGGFRGLISNALWIRLGELQEEDKFFEMAQLSDWITKLEPHFVQVWIVSAWNMSYNISVKFKDAPDRWRWVQRGIDLLRDDGLRFNPNEPLLYRELAWHFQHKMGAALDDANMYYKQQWLEEMTKVFGSTNRPNFAELIAPTTDVFREQSGLLREKYKMDAAFVRQVDERYGPLEWRLPEAHAVYWAAVGLQRAKDFPDKVKKEDLMTMRRVIYQSMQLAFQRGRLVANPYGKFFEFGPNIDIIPKVNAAYEEQMAEDAANREHISRGHRNFLRDAVYFLYVHGREQDAARWFKYLGEQYPKKNLIDSNFASFPGQVTLEEYCFSRLSEDIGDNSRDRLKSIIEGLLRQSYRFLVLEEDDRAVGFKQLARKAHARYTQDIAQRQEAVGLPPFEDIDREVVRTLLDPATDIPFEMRAVLRTRLNLPPESPPSTNAPPPLSPGATNSPPAPAVPAR